jgi:cyclic pyranopterin monophosphate synthase
MRLQSSPRSRVDEIPAGAAGEAGGDPGALTHIDEHGRARMVDVTAKALTRRVALAKCVVVTKGNANEALSDASGGLNVVEAARFAGMQAAKQTASLIPLCHPIRIDRIDVDIIVGGNRVEISAVTEIVERTGVEMEALTACSVAALTIVTAFIGRDPDVSIEELTLWHKSGGRSGDWERDGTHGRMTHTLAPPASPADEAAEGHDLATGADPTG